MTLLENQPTTEVYSDPHPLEVGEIKEISSEMVTDKYGRSYTRRDVEVGDEHDPFDYEILNGVGGVFEQYLRDNPHLQAPTLEELESEKGIKNEAADWLYPIGSAMRKWRKLFPRAKALYPLQKPKDGGRVIEGGDIDERTQYLFTNMVDGIGLRSRARIYADRLVSIAHKSPQEELRIVSLGSGAGVPNLDATQRVESELQKSIQWELFDMDPEALAFANELAQEAGPLRSTFDYGPTKRDEKGDESYTGRLYQRAFQLENESVDVIDALGLWEYLDKDQSTAFLKRLYEKLKPGGTMIVSNMLPDRPQLEFNQRAVGWPGLYLRSDQDLIDIVEAAGIDTELVTITHSADGVYAVMEIKKP